MRWGAINYIIIVTITIYKYSSTEAAQEYRKMKREVRMKMRASKEEWTEEQCKNVEKEMMSENSKEAYSTLNALTKT